MTESKAGPLGPFDEFNRIDTELIALSRSLDTARKDYCTHPCLETEGRYGDLYVRYNKLRTKWREAALKTTVGGGGWQK